MPLLFGFLVAILVKIFTSKIVIKLLGFGVLTATFAAFTAKMIALMSDLDTGISIPELDPAVLQGLNLLPPNTTTYLLIASCALIAQFAFIAISRSIKALT